SRGPPARDRQSAHGSVAAPQLAGLPAHLEQRVVPGGEEEAAENVREGGRGKGEGGRAKREGALPDTARESDAVTVAPGAAMPNVSTSERRLAPRAAAALRAAIALAGGR